MVEAVDKAAKTYLAAILKICSLVENLASKSFGPPFSVLSFQIFLLIYVGGFYNFSARSGGAVRQGTSKRAGNSSSVHSRAHNR
jgi:hypothetical protein